MAVISYRNGCDCDCGTTGSSVWGGWNETYTLTTGTSTAATASNNAIWTNWNVRRISTNSATGQSFTTDMIVWQQWNNAHRPHIIGGETPEERRVRDEARRAERARQEEQNRRIMEEARAADAKAEKLLIETLTPEQRTTWEKSGYFDVRLPDGRPFRIQRGHSHNVHRLDERGRARETYCAYPPGVPTADAVLAQKLMLEMTPEAFFSKANRGADPFAEPRHADGR